MVPSDREPSVEYDTYRVLLAVEIDAKNAFRYLGLTWVSIRAMPSRTRWLEVCDALVRRSGDRFPVDQYDFPLHGAPADLWVLRSGDVLDV